MDNAIRRKRLSSAERREVIEQCSTELFAECGYDGTSIDDIARRAGISAPVLYDHFPSKLALYRHLLERNFGELASIWTKQLDTPGTAEQRFRRAMDAWFAHMQQHAFTPILLFRVTTADANVRVLQQDIITRTKKLLMPLVASNLLGHSTSTDSQQNAKFEVVFEILSGTVQMLSLWWAQHPDTPREFITDTVIDTLWTGLRTDR